MMAPSAVGVPLLSKDLLVDLPYLLVPLLALVALILLLRGWARIRGRVRWLRTVLVVFGVSAFLVGLWLPTLMTSLRSDEQREQLQANLARLQGTLAKLDRSHGMATGSGAPLFWARALSFAICSRARATIAAPPAPLRKGRSTAMVSTTRR